MNRFITLLALLFSIPSATAAPIVHQVALGAKTRMKPGEVLKLKGSNYQLVMEAFKEPVKCAVPGFNCGSGYVPSHPTFVTRCDPTPCPYFYGVEIKDGQSAEVVIHTEESCTALHQDSQICFYDYSSFVKHAEDCLKLKSALGRYHCVQRFHSKLPDQMRGVCDGLPGDIPYLRSNCLYDWAIRYRDPGYCHKFTKQEIDGAARCWNKMAEELKDKTLCENIPPGNHYRGLCDSLKP